MARAYRTRLDPPRRLILPHLRAASNGASATARKLVGVTVRGWVSFRPVAQTAGLCVWADIPGRSLVSVKASSYANGVVMLIRAIDSETELMRPGCMAPPLVCVSVSDEHRVGQLYHHSNAVPIIRESLEMAARGDAILTGQYVAYDMAVFAAHDPSLIKPIFEAYEADGIVDTMLIEMMIDLWGGNLRMKWDEEEEAFVKVGYSLGEIVKRRFGVELDKGDDGYRLRYGELRHLPLDQWPERALKYATDDAIYTRQVIVEQLNQVARLEGDLLDDAPNQAACAFALHLMTVWGIITDGEAIAQLETNLKAQFAEHKAALLAGGFLKAKTKKNPDDLARDMAKIKAAVEAALGPNTPRTDKGAVSTSADTLAMTLDPNLMRVGEYVSTQKLLSTYVAKLWEGAGSTPIHSRFNPLLETGRTSSSKPNLQNPPRAAGVRECYVPRPGFVYASVDYDTAELRALAQCCLKTVGHSRLAEVYRADPNADPHIGLAAQMLGITEAEAMAGKRSGDKEVKATRQRAKAANFGFPGGMGARKFVEAQRKAKPPMVFTEDEAYALKRTWLNTWPEMQDYFAWVTEIAEGNGRFRSWANGLYRGGCDFCSGANFGFQAPVAAMAKRANFEAAKEMYVPSASPLYGSRGVVFAHDEIVAEVPSDLEHGDAAARRLGEIMCTVGNRYCPDVPITASPALMRRWRKGAESRYLDGVLVPWEPK